MEKVRQTKKGDNKENQILDKKIIPYVKILISLVILQIILSVLNVNLLGFHLNTYELITSILTIIGILILIFKD